MWFQRYRHLSLTMSFFPSSLNASRLLTSFFILIFPLSLWINFINKTLIIEWEIISIQSSHINFIIILDPIGTLFRSTVLFISANVIYFSSSYIADEVFLKRFIHLVLLFVASINLLIFIPHMIILLLGWDGLGLVSFLLVIYYQNAKSLAAGIITALINRVGDVIILLRIGWTLNQAHWSIINIWANNFSPVITLCIIIAAITKRAQIPFSRWLPAAIAAPTPVSALVHSSTLVTAGVFLIIRFYPFLHKTTWFNNSILLIATTTILIAGIRALAECDIKKIIALSTLSQLGVIIIRLGLNFPHLAFFHLITHALFKALLFLCAGSIIHLHHHSQDLRFIGNLSSQIPLTTTCLLTANLALCGSPFLAGFYSKDMIIESTLFFNNNILIISILILATALTAAYSIRIMLTVVWGPLSSLPYQYTSDEDKALTIPMVNLTAGAICRGAALNWFIFQPIMEPVLPFYLKIAAILVTIIGAWLAWITTSYTTRTPAFSLTYTSPHHFNAFIWFLVPTTAQGILYLPIQFAHKLLSTLDQGWVEFLGAQGTFKAFSRSSALKEKWLGAVTTTHLSLSLIFITFIILIYC